MRRNRFSQKTYADSVNPMIFFEYRIESTLHSYRKPHYIRGDFFFVIINENFSNETRKMMHRIESTEYNDYKIFQLLNAKDFYQKTFLTKTFIVFVALLL